MAPRFDLELTPLRDESSWTGFGVDYTVELPAIGAGEELFRLPQVITSIPGMVIGAGDFDVSDEQGELTVTEGEAQPDIAGVARIWSADRDTVGAVRVRYTAPARVIDELTPVGPLFDLRAEQYGLVGAGVWFLALPPTTGSFDVSLRWNANPDLLTISGAGFGDANWIGSLTAVGMPLKSVQFQYYAAGTPHSAPRVDPAFGLHAFSDTPFDMAPIAEYLEALYRDMSAFFGSDDESYHVLVRRNLSKGTGGTALPGAFAFGYSAIDEPDVDAMRSLLAHEMAHNWPRLDGDATTASWYTEGTAEYYSLVLALRGGHLTPAAFADALTERFSGYDANPLRSLSNDDAYAAYWVDPRAQRVPYGRGLRYLVATNAHILAASGGTRSLDDVVKHIVHAQATGSIVDQDGWVDLVAEYLGVEARTQYDAMMAGSDIELPDAIFEGVVRPVADSVHEVEVGFDMASFHTEPRAVTGLVAGSAAAAAGLQDGDELISRAISYTAIRGKSAVELVVRRDGEEREISYSPAGRLTPTVRWELVEETP